MAILGAVWTFPRLLLRGYWTVRTTDKWKEDRVKGFTALLIMTQVFWLNTRWYLPQSPMEQLKNLLNDVLRRELKRRGQHPS